MTTGGAETLVAKDVVLVDAGVNPPMVADVVRAMTGVDYATARDLVARTPSTVRSRIAPALAEALRVRLEGAGGRVEVRDHGAAPELCDVFLRDHGDRKIEVIRALKDSLRLGLREASELASASPAFVARKLGRDQAETLVHELVEAGANVELRAHVPEPARPLAATIVAAAPVASAPEPATAEKAYEVLLHGCGPNKINVIKIIREATGLGLKECKDLAESTDVTIKRDLREHEAVALMRALAEVGVSVEVRGSDGAPAAVSGAIEASCDVVLHDFGGNKIAVIKLIRELTNLGLKEAKDLAETPGSTIKEAVPRHEAKEIEQRFIAAGAKVSLVECEDSVEHAEEEEVTGLVDVLLRVCGPNKISVIKEVRSLTGLGLKESKDLVESAPCTLMQQVDAAQAREIQRRLLEVGASVELR